MDRKTKTLVGPEAVGKHGTPKCEMIMKLLRTEEPEHQCLEGEVWVGAHPSIGEKITSQLIERGALDKILGPVKSVQREVTGVAGTDMRVDF